MRNAVDAASDDDGWATLGAVGSIINKQRPDFDARSYGYGKLSRSSGEGRPKMLYVRNRAKPGKG